MAANRAAEYTLTLTEEEREELLRLLEQADEELRGEQRRTESPKYHEEVRQEEHLLARLVEKVRRLTH